MSHSVYDILGIIADFDEDLAKTGPSDRHGAIKNHLKKMDELNFRVPNFQRGLDWLNVSEELNFDNHLQGKLVILDFFTYCCINCMHILPDLEVVEEKFPVSTGVAVVGVHSAKFLNEKTTANIISAVLRYDIHHPVVNDANAEMWQALAVSCWPTLVFVGPQGQLLYSLAGEGNREKITEFLCAATEHYEGQLKFTDLSIDLMKDKMSAVGLKFPGKICIWPEKQWLVISDTGNHRIVITDYKGIVKHIIGSGQRGRKDGNSEEAEFNSPQGVACDSSSVYIADTNNHLLRQIVFEGNKTKVSTLAGTGQQGSDKEGGERHVQQELSSPWDVAVAVTPDGASQVLLIAMAGTHQIWAYFLADGSWYKNQSYPSGTCLRFAGSGAEENRNNSYPEKAGFAQPSGLAVTQNGSGNGYLYIADSESSSVRAICLKDCKVSGVVGGERDPTNLFAFGDIDGKGIQAKLQHPLGVALFDDVLFVADSYNHKIKHIDLKTNICETIAGCGSPGNNMSSSDLKQCQFNEPGGLAMDKSRELLYIADTNNHAVKVLDLKNNLLSQLPIVFPTGVKIDSSLPKKPATQEQLITGVALPDLTANISDNTLQIRIPVHLSDGEHLNLDAPNSWKLTGTDEQGVKFADLLLPSARSGDLVVSGKDDDPSVQNMCVSLEWRDGVQPGIITLGLTLQIFVCLDADVCLPPRDLKFVQKITFKNKPSTQEQTISGVALPDLTANISDKKLQIHIPVHLSDGEHLNLEAPNSWKLTGTDEQGVKFPDLLLPSPRSGDLVVSGKGDDPSVQNMCVSLEWRDGVQPGIVTLGLTLQIFVCLDADVCLPPRDLKFVQKITFVSS